MELSKNITLGQYIPRQSPIHRLDPRVKLLGWVALAVILFSIRTLSGYLIFAAVMLWGLRISQVPLGYALRGIKPMLPFLLFLWVFQVLFSGSLYPWSMQVVYQWHFIDIRLEGVWFSTLLMVRVILLFLSVTWLTLATALVSLTDGTESLLSLFKWAKVPANELAMIGVIALRFVPTMVDEQERIMKAQMARAADLDQGNWLMRVKARIPMLIPMFISTMRRAEEMIVAMESRCYRGGEGRTKRKQLKLQALDWKAIGVLTVFVAGMLVYNYLMPPLMG
ncbi:MAG: energy-coupling factor transporter transmembrane protein EcfT [Desulfitobacteriaceae bacterium]|nr:energy-coupling factor transporter transmembrane protein EcfT [Desulfitobacteriaceae bacterium]MDI6915182.1 energy-coupling factor transporter transmembrane protein EcfT [Desulfitobacteriaceae bacterium]